jgi:hypothetical protein
MRHQSTKIHIERKDKSDYPRHRAATWLRECAAFSLKACYC